ncbi:hypothetical protein [Mycoplasmopsis gallinacea]|uniref:Uncharacterized protein n=1 Tax=Mycoplasmopsis gallinacea TaxID=29556 RepID=A0A6H0V1W9_9BACT|nr:hypothetical protein [Mycoplasmopsis gallinacea]QIW62340.1 hypothetical protein GOQ20_02810 [Mycoplasmopsis gallinacea]
MIDGKSISGIGNAISELLTETRTVAQQIAGVLVPLAFSILFLILAFKTIWLNTKLKGGQGDQNTKDSRNTLAIATIICLIIAVSTGVLLNVL